MNKKYSQLLKKIFTTPPPANIIWKNVISLLMFYDAKITEGKGSRVRIALRDSYAVFHRPHPRKEMDKGAVVSLRNFLKNAGIMP